MTAVGEGVTGLENSIGALSTDAVPHLSHHTTKWEVHKFGGSSVRDAACYRKVAAVLAEAREKRLTEAHEWKQGIVVSAMAGVTDALLELVRKACARENDYVFYFTEVILKRHYACINELLFDNEPLRASLTEAIESDASNIENVLRAVYLTSSATEFLEELISGHGEVWSAQILAAFLQHQGRISRWIDARQVLIVEPNQRTSMTPDINWDLSSRKLHDWFVNAAPDYDSVVITGFVAATNDGVYTTLKRNGSDYSGSIFGALLKAEEITIWTDVDGVYSADPRMVPDALLINEMSYTEAGEFSFYGAKIIHPKTMLPAIRMQVPVWIRNTFNPTCPGTRIFTTASPVSRHGTPPLPDQPWNVIMGFCTIDNLSLIMVRGGIAGAMGYVSMSVRERLQRSLGNINVPLILAAQASPEHAICFCVPKTHGAAALRRIEEDFAEDLSKGHLLSVQLLNDYTILTGVGDRISQTPGVAACFFSALERAKVNVLGVAQNGERVMCVVVESQNAPAGLRALHAMFKVPQRSVALALIGAGRIGTGLIRQLCPGLTSCHSSTGLNINLRCVASTQRMLLHDSITQDQWDRSVSTGEGLETTDWQRLLRHVTSTPARHKILIDTSGSAEIAARYTDILRSGIHVLSSNKNIVDLPADVLQSFQRGGTRSVGTDFAAYNTHCWYEAALGGGVPIAKVLRQLADVGETVTEVEAVVSGTWASIFNTIAPATDPNGAASSAKFSSAACDCYSLGLLEPDPRSDLSGRDAAMALSLISMVIGDPVRVDDVAVNMPLAGPLPECSTLADLMRVTSQYDAQMAALVEEAASKNQVPRLIASYRRGKGCSVEIRMLDRDDVFARLPDSQNAFVIRTEANTEGTLLKGACAGSPSIVDVIYADLIQLVKFAFTKAQVR